MTTPSHRSGTPPHLGALTSSCLPAVCAGCCQTAVWLLGTPAGLQAQEAHTQSHSRGCAARQHAPLGRETSSNMWNVFQGWFCVASTFFYSILLWARTLKAICLRCKWFKGLEKSEEKGKSEATMSSGKRANTCSSVSLFGRGCMSVSDGQIYH